MKGLLILSFFLSACSTGLKNKGRDKYSIILDLWKQKANREKVIQELGSNYKEVDRGIIYLFANFNFPEGGYFFDETQKLDEQFLFVDEKAFIQLKEKIPCSWEEKVEPVARHHTIDQHKTGLCIKEKITYEYKNDIKLYEVRWKK